MARAETIAFYQCLNRRCNVNFYPVEAGSACPVCGFGGSLAGTAVKVHEPSEAADDEDGGSSPDPVLPEL